MPEKQQDLGKDRKDRSTQILDKVEVAFFRVLVGSKVQEEGGIPRIQTERYTDNNENIVFSWQGQDGISRNVNAYLTASTRGMAETQTPVRSRANTELVIEVNAWKDELNPDGSGTKKLHQVVIDRLSLSSLVPRLSPPLHIAHQTASVVDESMLTQEVPLKSPSELGISL